MYRVNGAQAHLMVLQPSQTFTDDRCSMLNRLTFVKYNRKSPEIFHLLYVFYFFFFSFCCCRVWLTSWNFPTLVDNENCPTNNTSVSCVGAVCVCVCAVNLYARHCKQIAKLKICSSVSCLIMEKKKNYKNAVGFRSDPYFGVDVNLIITMMNNGRRRLFHVFLLFLFSFSSPLSVVRTRMNMNYCPAIVH